MQRGLADALLNPDAPLPDGLIDPQGRPAHRRFSVYRNNVASSLTRAMEAGFPVVRRLVGDEFFGAMAVIHLRRHPPRSPILTLYGADFPEFLSGFPPVAHLGYLPCVARLELAIRASYHAADATPATLESLGPDPMSARLRLAPAVRLLDSPWPIWSIWQAQTNGGPSPVMRPEPVLILRPGFDPKPHLVTAATARFITALMAHQTLAEAVITAGPELSLGDTLTLLVSNQAIAGTSP